MPVRIPVTITALGSTADCARCGETIDLSALDEAVGILVEERRRRGEIVAAGPVTEEHRCADGQLGGFVRRPVGEPRRVLVDGERW